MKKENLKKIIKQQEFYFFPKKQVSREALVSIKTSNKNEEIVIISGIRRCGKSTLLNIFRKTEKDKNYCLNFDDFRLINFDLLDFEKLEECFYELYGEESIFYFDEIQNIKGWERYVRTLYEKKKKVFITGSNASMLSYELGTHLTGRNIKIELFPFSFEEFLSLKGCDYQKLNFYLIKDKDKILKKFDEYLDKGGFPQYIKTNDKNILREIYKDIIFRDILVRHKLKNERIIQELCFFLISNISKEISFNKLKNLLSLSNTNTIKQYLSYLENSYLFFSINKFDYSLKKQIVNNKKIYCIDNAISKIIGFQFSENIGRQLENLVFIELKRKGLEIYFHKRKKECDFLIKKRNKIKEAIQVTKSISEIDTKKREIAGLIEAMEEHNLKRGLILTYDEEDEFKIDGFKIIVKPIWKWLISHESFAQLSFVTFLL